MQFKQLFKWMYGNDSVVWHKGIYLLYCSNYKQIQPHSGRNEICHNRQLWVNTFCSIIEHTVDTYRTHGATMRQNDAWGWTTVSDHPKISLRVKISWRLLGCTWYRRSRKLWVDLNACCSIICRCPLLPMCASKLSYQFWCLCIKYMPSSELNETPTMDSRIQHSVATSYLKGV